MKHKPHRHGPDAEFSPDASGHEADHHHRHHHHHGKRGRHHSGRLFDYGELRLLLLAMIAERPRHGYELIKAIEERMEGRYTPSPGVMYPTLAWLDDMGYAQPQTETSGRKCYGITPEGAAFLVANRAAADELLSRSSAAAKDDSAVVPEAIAEAIGGLKQAMRLRLRQGPIDEDSASHIASLISAATRAIENQG